MPPRRCRVLPCPTSRPCSTHESVAPSHRCRFDHARCSPGLLRPEAMSTLFPNPSAGAYSKEGPCHRSLRIPRLPLTSSRHPPSGSLEQQPPCGDSPHLPKRVRPTAFGTSERHHLCQSPVPSRPPKRNEPWTPPNSTMTEVIAKSPLVPAGDEKPHAHPTLRLHRAWDRTPDSGLGRPRHQVSLIRGRCG